MNFARGLMRLSMGPCNSRMPSYVVVVVVVVVGVVVVGVVGVVVSVPVLVVN